MTKEEEIRRAEEAGRILGNDLVKEAFEIAKQHHMAEWFKTKPADVDAREKIWQRVQAIEDWRWVLEGIVQNGRFVAADIEREKQLEKAGMIPQP